MRNLMLVFAVFSAAALGACFGNLCATHFVLRQWERAEKQRRAEKSARMQSLYERMRA